MGRARWGRHLGSTVVLLGALGIAPTALAADPPPAASQTPAPAASATSKPAGAKTQGHARRPIFLGLLAAAFLIIGAIAGANDRPGGDPPKA